MGFDLPKNLPAVELPEPLKLRVDQSLERFKQALGPIAVFASADQLEQYRKEIADVATFAYAAGYRAAAKRRVRT